MEDVLDQLCVTNVHSRDGNLNAVLWKVFVVSEASLGVNVVETRLHHQQLALLVTHSVPVSVHLVPNDGDSIGFALCTVQTREHRASGAIQGSGCSADKHQWLSNPASGPQLPISLKMTQGKKISSPLSICTKSFRIPSKHWSFLVIWNYYIYKYSDCALEKGRWGLLVIRKAGLTLWVHLVCRDGQMSRRQTFSGSLASSFPGVLQCIKHRLYLNFL